MPAHESTGWRRYVPGDVLPFNEIVVAVDPRGNGRLTHTQALHKGDRYLVLPPLSQLENATDAST